jgi:RNA polymerase primary sigma factor
MQPLDHYLDCINETPLLSPEQERIVPRESLIRANLRLVVHVARYYVGHGLSMEDMIGYGNAGLCHAVDLYDRSRTTRFATYAVFWIRQSIRSAIRTTVPVIRIPCYMVQTLRRYRALARQHTKADGSCLSHAALARKLKLSKRQSKFVKDALRLQCGRLELDDNHDVPDRRDMVTLTNEETSHALSFVDELDAIPRKIIRLRFGLSGSEPMTLREIGNIIGLTRERVRQIERDALAKLREMITA